nr:GrpE nucleotide exchange factor [Tanacetum cinerariifolium]
MVVGRITSRIARTVASRYQSVLIRQPKSLSIIGRRAIHASPNKVIPAQISFLHSSALTSSPFQRFGFSSSASSEANEKRASDSDVKENASSDDKGLGEEDLTMDDLVKIVTEKEELLKAKQEEIADMKDK